MGEVILEKGEVLKVSFVSATADLFFRVFIDKTLQFQTRWQN